MIKFCPECGVKLEQDYKFCPECGFDLKKNKSSKPNIKQPVQTQTKGLNTGTIIGLFGGIIAVVVLLLYLSGIFDSPKLPVQQIQGNQQQESGVDLNRMNEINNLEEQVKANPGDLQKLLQLAHMKNDAGLPQQAVINYRQYLEKNPSDADARVDMGVCYYVLHDYKTAISEMKTALKYQPDHQIAHLNLGIVNFAAGNTAESKEWLKKTVDLNPNSDVGKRAQELLNSH